MPVYGLDHSARSGLSDRLAHFAAGLCLQEVPPEVIETATWLFVNSVGVAVSNAADPMVEQARSLEPDRHHGPASLWGTTHRSSITTAAIANGIAAHISDFDDTHAEGGVHVGAVVAPALVATAEQEGASGSALLTGLIVAFEVMCRLGAAAPHRFTVRGYLSLIHI